MDSAMFGHYRLDGLLGRGGMGEVYRAYDTEQERVVALKVLPASLSDDDDYRQRFRREARLASQLTDPHIVPIHRHGEIDGQLYLDMRLVDGDNLASVLYNEGALHPEAAVRLVEQVASALDAAHDAGLIHRDVKPSNVFLTRPTRSGAPRFAYLGDFGIARALSPSTNSVRTATGSALGTLDYMAPERFLGRELDAGVDVYALACLLHECLTATKPFPGTELPALMHAHLNTPPPRPSALVPVPLGLDAVVERGMAKDPGQRHRSAGELAGHARAAITAPTVPPRDAGSTDGPPTMIGGGTSPTSAELRAWEGGSFGTGPPQPSTPRPLPVPQPKPTPRPLLQPQPQPQPAQPPPPPVDHGRSGFADVLAVETIAIYAALAVGVSVVYGQSVNPLLSVLGSIGAGLAGALLRRLVPSERPLFRIGISALAGAVTVNAALGFIREEQVWIAVGCLGVVGLALVTIVLGRVLTAPLSPARQRTAAVVDAAMMAVLLTLLPVLRIVNVVQGRDDFTLLVVVLAVLFGAARLFARPRSDRVLGVLAALCVAVAVRFTATVLANREELFDNGLGYVAILLLVTALAYVVVLVMALWRRREAPNPR